MAVARTDDGVDLHYESIGAGAVAVRRRLRLWRGAGAARAFLRGRRLCQSVAGKKNGRLFRDIRGRSDAPALLALRPARLCRIQGAIYRAFGAGRGQYPTWRAARAALALEHDRGNGQTDHADPDRQRRRGLALPQPGLLLKQVISSAALAVLPNCGHTMNLEAAEDFNHVVDAFLAHAASGRWAQRDPRAMVASITGVKS